MKEGVFAYVYSCRVNDVWHTFGIIERMILNNMNSTPHTGTYDPRDKSHASCPLPITQTYVLSWTLRSCLLSVHRDTT